MNSGQVERRLSAAPSAPTAEQNDIMLAPAAAWPQLHKQCFSDDASSESSITECLQPGMQHVQRSDMLRSQPHQGPFQKSQEHSAGEASDITGAQLPQLLSVTNSPTGAKASDTVTQRVSSRLRKRQRDTSDSGEHSALMHASSRCLRHPRERYFLGTGVILRAVTQHAYPWHRAGTDRAVKWQQAAVAGQQAAEASAEAQRKVRRADRPVIVQEIPQHTLQYS